MAQQSGNRWRDSVANTGDLCVRSYFSAGVVACFRKDRILAINVGVAVR